MHIYVSSLLIPRERRAPKTDLLKNFRSPYSDVPLKLGESWIEPQRSFCGDLQCSPTIFGSLYHRSVAGFPSDLNASIPSHWNHPSQLPLAWSHGSFTILPEKYPQGQAVLMIYLMSPTKLSVTGPITRTFPRPFRNE